MATPVIISGCSGGGKSTLLEALAHRGFATLPEPGRRVIAEETAAGGTALPWTNLRGFLLRARDLALEDRAAAQSLPGPVFCDRGLIDALAALDALDGTTEAIGLARRHPYHPTVFLTPPWPEIYVRDADRRHGLEAAVAEYDRLRRLYPALGYDVTILPKVPVAERVTVVLDRLGLA